MYLGPGPILANVGGDATIPFETAHGEDAYKFLATFKIGELEISLQQTQVSK